MKSTIACMRRQRGAVAIIVGLVLAVLMGFAGLALDLGHLYVEKTELQNAADACALAASRELTCDPSAGPCAASFLVNAENSGLAVARRNKVDFQKTAIGDNQIAASDIKFSTTFTPDSSYLSRAAGASPASKYVVCNAKQTGVIPWFMGVLGIGAQSVSARAVATLAPSQANCAIPLGMCKLDAAPASNPLQGLAIGTWMTSKLSSSATGSFDWIDFTPPGGGASELADLIKGSGSCSLPPKSTQVGEQGKKTSLAKAWNTRFGLYTGSDNYTNATPDYTGESYTPTSWPSKFNAYAGPNLKADGTPNTGGIPNFLTGRANHSVYEGGAAAPKDDGLNIKNNVTSASQANLVQYGADRRLVTVPVVDCSSWKGSKPQTVPVLDYACGLMLHPMDKDSDDVWIEYRGKSTDIGNPCATSGSVGGAGSIGPLVPALVQ